MSVLIRGIEFGPRGHQSFHLTNVALAAGLVESRPPATAEGVATEAAEAQADEGSHRGEAAAEVVPKKRRAIN